MHHDHDLFLTQLYENNFRKLNRYACLFLRSLQAEEIVQDTFHEAVEKIDILYSHAKPEAWLMNVVKNKIRNVQRRNQKDLFYK